MSVEPDHRRYLFLWRDAVMGSDLPPMTKLVALNLSRYMKTATGQCFVGVGRQATDCGLKSERTVQRHLRRLEDPEARYLWTKIRGGTGNANMYTACFPKGYWATNPVPEDTLRALKPRPGGHPSSSEDGTETPSPESETPSPESTNPVPGATRTLSNSQKGTPESLGSVGEASANPARDAVAQLATGIGRPKKRVAKETEADWEAKRRSWLRGLEAHMADEAGEPEADSEPAREGAGP